MRFAKLSMMVFCLVLCLATPSFSLDPYKDNTGGFGPRIAGTRLGSKMSLRDIVKWRVNLRGLPFTLEINSERIPGRKPSEVGNISILLNGRDKDFTGFRITNAGKDFYRLRNESMKLPDLLAEIEKIGVETITLRAANGRVKEDCISFTEDLRVSAVRVRRSDLGAGQMPHEDFVREFTKTYGLPEMRRRGNAWSFRNSSEGWQITYYGLGDGIFELLPLI